MEQRRRRTFQPADIDNLEYRRSHRAEQQPEGDNINTASLAEEPVQIDISSEREIVRIYLPDNQRDREIAPGKFIKDSEKFITDLVSEYNRLLMQGADKDKFAAQKSKIDKVRSAFNQSDQDTRSICRSISEIISNEIFERWSMAEFQRRYLGRFDQKEENSTGIPSETIAQNALRKMPPYPGITE